MKERAVGHTQQESAQVANISERSGKRIETGQHQPQAREKKRTRLDLLEAVRRYTTLLIMSTMIALVTYCRGFLLFSYCVAIPILSRFKFLPLATYRINFNFFYLSALKIG